MLVMTEVFVNFTEARRNISEKLNRNGNLLDNNNSDLIMRAIQFIIDPKYEFGPEVNELFQNYQDILSVKIIFINKDQKLRFCKDDKLSVVRQMSEYLKTVQINIKKRVKIKTFYNWIHQDYEPDVESISRPYIITEQDADDFRKFTSTELFNFVSSAVSLNQQINMTKSHDTFVKNIKIKMTKCNKIINSKRRAETLNAITEKYEKLIKNCKEKHSQSTASKDTMNKNTFLSIKSSIIKAEKLFKILTESNITLGDYELKFFLITDEEKCLENEYFQMDVLKKLFFYIYDKDGNTVDTTNLIQLNYFVYISLCLGLIEQIGFPYLLITIVDFVGGFQQKIQEIIEEMNDVNLQFFILKD